MYFHYFFFSDRYMINFIKLEKNFTEKEIFKSLYSNLFKKNVKFTFIYKFNLYIHI